MRRAAARSVLELGARRPDRCSSSSLGLFAPRRATGARGRLARRSSASLALLGLSFVAASPAAPLFGGAFVQDDAGALRQAAVPGSATLIGVLGSLALRAGALRPAGDRVPLRLLASLLGMLVLASARELMLLFVAFELMSIPLYVLTGFLKRERAAVGGGAEVLPGRHRLVGGARLRPVVHLRRRPARTDAARRSRAALGAGPSAAACSAWCWCWRGLGFKIAAFPFHMWVPDTYEAASTPFVAWLSVAPKAAGFVVDLPRSISKASGAAGAALGAGRRRARRR